MNSFFGAFSESRSSRSLQDLRAHQRAMETRMARSWEAMENAKIDLIQAREKLKGVERSLKRAEDSGSAKQFAYLQMEANAAQERLDQAEESLRASRVRAAKDSRDNSNALDEVIHAIESHKRRRD